VLFRVSHYSRYDYDVPVSLGAHRVRLLPRNLNQVVYRADVFVDPLPMAIRDEIDPSGNLQRVVEFNGSTRHLEVRTSLEVEVVGPPNLAHSLPGLPWSPPGAELAEFYSEVRQPSVVAYAQNLLSQSGPDPIAFLDHLTGTLFLSFHRHIRHTGAARTPEETLALRSGACRDLTVLFVAICQSLGLAARFVSGYQARSQTPDGERHLHAWAEVFLGQLGWRGFDPTHGERATDGHLALHAGANQASTMPIEGGFLFAGPKVNSTLTYSVRINTT
jgi:transglutaminase-like putative cysteine protease